MRSRRRYLWLTALLSFAGAMAPAIASSEPLPVEAVNEPAVGPYPETHHWSNVPQTVIAGEKVTFGNPTTVYHGVEWLSATKPTCEKGGAGEGNVPVGAEPSASGIEWSGKCTFSQPGTYTFYCTVHGAAMSGTITVKTVGEPTASTESASGITEHEAVLEGTVNPEGKATTYHFDYGTSAGYGQETPEEPAGSGSVDRTVTANVSGLSPGVTYHYRVVANNSSGTTRGFDRTFTTQGPPAATTTAATAVSETEATLKGAVNPDGKPTKYLFEWGTTESYGHSTEEAPAGEDHLSHAASATLKELAPGFVYHYRIVAKNASAETAAGGDQTFTTVHAPQPQPEPTPQPAPPPPTPGPPPSGPLLEPPPGATLVAGSLKVLVPRHGSSLRGLLEVAQAGAGGRLEVDLIAKTASLAKANRSGSASTRVGRFVRTSIPPGKVSFLVALTARGKSALRRHRRLGLTVKITLTPTHGAAASMTRSVVLHA
jgi:plastocyanin